MNKVNSDTSYMYISLVSSSRFKTSSNCILYTLNVSVIIVSWKMYNSFEFHKDYKLCIKKQFCIQLLARTYICMLCFHTMFCLCLNIGCSLWWFMRVWRLQKKKYITSVSRLCHFFCTDRFFNDPHESSKNAFICLYFKRWFT